MATYNLNAADLITLLASTVQNKTAGAILQTLEQNGSFPYPGGGGLGTATFTGPSGGSTLAAQNDTIPSTSQSLNTKFALIDLPTSTADPTAAYPQPGTVPSGTSTVFSFTSPGGVVIASGDQNVVVKDSGLGGDTLVGGAGSEKLAVSTGSNLLIGGSGLNTLIGGSGNDTLIGGGQTREQAGFGANLLIGGVTSSAHDTLVGASGADTLSVTYGDNRLVAAGPNSLFGGAGSDTMFGASGAYLQAGSGTARMYTEAGPETVVAGSGSDTVVALSNSGQLNVVGGIGALRVVDNGNNSLGTGGASLTLAGGLGAERVLLGSLGVDTASNNTIKDSITGGSGAMSIVSYQSAGSLVSNSSSVAGGTHTLTFHNGQVIVVNDANNNITLNFNGGGSAVV